MKKYLSLLIGFILILSCNNNKPSTTVVKTSKISESDPFKETMVESQFFEINAKEDNVVEGKNGTVVVFPKGCFLDSDSNVVEDGVKIELAEALEMKDMILSNLNTTSDGKLLESDGMIYINAFDKDGNQLTISKDNPIHIEIPTKKKIAGMMAFKGIRDKMGLFL
jgi:hypothetical protein